MAIDRGDRLRPEDAWSAGIEDIGWPDKQRDLLRATIAMLVTAVSMRDDFSGRHSSRVVKYASLLGQQLGLSRALLPWLRFGAALHDYGKIAIKDKILYKPGNLTPEEFEEMKTHTIKGAQVVEQIAVLSPILSAVRSHHERWDGKGYPDGLKGEAIPCFARIIAVADTFDTMTADQPYRAGVPGDAALAEIEKMRGLQFDPQVASAFVAIGPSILRTMNE